jgi:molecular chaperone DnaJ/curved DNA-binding protein
MKDYYKILGVSENANQQQIKSAFRKLAFQYHPDKNPGNEKAAEAKFKEINEAFAVLGDENKRKQYDLARKGAYAGAGYEGFNYSQQDIFNSMFTNQAFYEELSRIFSQAGLRFDRNFYEQTFTNGNVIFRFYTSTGNKGPNYSGSQFTSQADSYKPNWLERMVTGLLNKITRHILKRLFGIEYKPDLNIHSELEIIPDEALSGTEKEITYQRGKRKKKLVVKIPAGVETGTKIRLKGMGLAQKNNTGDLIVHIRVREQSPLNSG